jgi:hypothetical protein
MHSGLAERAVVGNEAAGDVICDRSHEPAHYFDAQSRGASDERLGALARDDVRNLTSLG